VIVERCCVAVSHCTRAFFSLAAALAAAERGHAAGGLPTFRSIQDSDRTGSLGGDAPACSTDASMGGPDAAGCFGRCCSSSSFRLRRDNDENVLKRPEESARESMRLSQFISVTRGSSLGCRTAATLVERVRVSERVGCCSGASEFGLLSARGRRR